ncbi:MAG TPA: acyl-CoA thioesterase II [Xanthomonadales bacterium]|nr:acyl-CoA thioesterase II [Xanthomonadales bacterium]
MNDQDKSSFSELLRLIRLEQLEVNLFRGQSRDIGTPRVFGGQVLAQAVLAASKTVEDRLIHSLHAYFLLPGNPDAPIVYNVEHNRDGGSFSSRRVLAIQHGRPIFNLAASFQVREEGLEHQFEMPDVPEPENLKSGLDVSAEKLKIAPEMLRRWCNQFGPFDFRPVDGDSLNLAEPSPPNRKLWFRLRGNPGDDQLVHRALLAYVSDFHLFGTAMLPHGISWFNQRLMVASLDHAMWFHHDARVDEWLLYDCDSPITSGGRGLARGSIFDSQGRLVASTAQEGVLRLRPEEPSGDDSGS